jgi:hypothetical protein
MSFQKQDHPAIKVLISGISGTGKSTLFEKLIRRDKAKWVFLYDHKDGDLARRFNAIPCFTIEDFIAAAERGGMVIFNPGRMFPGEPEKGFEEWTEWIWDIRGERGKKIIGADELDAIADLHSKPQFLQRILDQGRTYQMDCIFISQAANNIHNLIRKQFTEIFAFMQGDENATIWLKQKGFDSDALLNLPYGKWFYKNVLTSQFSEGGEAFEPKNASRNLRGL